jgi:DNA-binding transcriptional LysR family regulator
MSLRQLEIIFAILRTGSVTEAARELHVSQPAVSIALRQYEDRLGTALFERRRGRLVPTAEARQLLPDLEDVFDRLDFVQRRLRDLAAGEGGSLSLVSTAAILSSDLAEAVARYRRAHPEVRIDLRRMTTTQVIERVARGHAELGLAHLEAPDQGLAAERLADIQVVCALPRNHPLSGRALVHLADLAAYPVITYAPESNIGRPVRQAFEALGLALRDQVIINDAPTGFHLARMGVGAALVGHLASRGLAMSGLKIRPILPAIPVPVVLLTRPDRPLSQNALRMVALLRQIREPPVGK